MPPWQVLSIEQLDENSYTVLYLLHGKRKARATLHPTFGLDKSIVEMGNFLATLPEFNGAPIGG